MAQNGNPQEQIPVRAKTPEAAPAPRARGQSPSTSSLYAARPLVPADAAALLRFYNALSPETIRLFRPLGRRASLKRCRRIVAENSLSPAPRVDWVVRRDGETEIAGWVFLERLTTDRPELGIAVADRLQNQGLGSALLEHAMLGARLRGLEAVYLIVVQDNEHAIALYEKHGFETYAEEFDEHDQLPYFHMVARLAPTP